LREALPTGEPTSQPSGEPSGQPSGQPSGEPSGQPSAEPSGQPTGEPSGQPTGQPSGQPTDQPSGQPSIQPSDQPSGQPSMQPSCQPSDQPTGEPSSVPSGQPSAQPSSHPSSQPSSDPTSQPSGQPSCQPTSQPSNIPTSHPTFISPIGTFFESGGTDSKPVVFSLPGIGYVNNTLPLYLSVDVWPTNYAMRSEQWASITVNGVSLMDHCIPDESCGEIWFRCFENVNIADLISERNGGYIDVEVSSTGVNTGPCDKNGFPLYSRVILKEALSHQEKLSVWVIIGSILGGLMFLILVLWLLFVYFVRLPAARVYRHKDSSLMEPNDKIDVESCVENEDNCEDYALYSFQGTKDTVEKLGVEKSMALNLSKVVPFEDETDLDKEERGVGVALNVGRPPPKGVRRENSRSDIVMEDVHH